MTLYKTKIIGKKISLLLAKSIVISRKLETKFEDELILTAHNQYTFES